MVFIVLMYKFFKSYINNFMVKDSIHFFFRQERRVKIKFSPSQVTFCPTLSGVGSLFQGLLYHIRTSVTCFNSVISFCWYCIITSVTCFNSVISFCWYYIITNKCYMLQLCYKLLLVLHYNKCYMLQLC